MSWVKAGHLGDLSKAPLVFKHPPRQIALFKAGDNVFAIDNRCPHEGYPLAAGTVSKDCVLTCNWHNWKFRLENGQCVVGGDNVRSYTTRVDAEGDVWVDISAPPLEETRQQIFKGLKTAFGERDYGRICREIARLHFHGLDTLDAVREAIQWSHDRLEHGSADTHAFAATADWLALGDHFKGNVETEVSCLAECVDHMAHDTLRQPVFAYGAPADGPFSRQKFLQAVELEQASIAEGMVVRALADGLHWSDLEETLVAAALAHYNDFGHSLIYIPKTAALLNRLGSTVEPALMLPLVRQFCYASREDLIPDFKEYGATLRSLPEPRFENSGSVPAPIPFPCTLAQAFVWLGENLAHCDVFLVYDSLLAGLARNLLYYDTRYGHTFDRPVQDNVGWLDFTHGVTFSNAVRVICTRYPGFWRSGLLQMACFLGRNSHYVDLAQDQSAWEVHDFEAFFREARMLLLDHGVNLPVIAAHLLKTTMAVESEIELASPLCKQLLTAALNRFLHSPIKGKHVRRQAKQAIALVSRDF